MSFYLLYRFVTNSCIRVVRRAVLVTTRGENLIAQISSLDDGVVDEFVAPKISFQSPDIEAAAIEAHELRQLHREHNLVSRIFRFILSKQYFALCWGVLKCVI